MGDSLTGPDRERARIKYRRLAPRYDRFIAGFRGRIAGFGRLRAAAIGKLDLRAGDCVIDVGCGTGLSFSAIEHRIGPSGRLIGVELSPDMLAVARARVRRQGWENVELIEGSVQDAAIEASVDAAVFCLVHDITRSPRAVENVVGRVRPGGRIAVAGGKALPRKMFPFDRLSRRLLARFVTTFDGIEEPWTILAESVPSLLVDAKPLRLTYLAWGDVRR